MFRRIPPRSFFQDGWTPLIACCHRGNLDAAQVLLKMPNLNIGARDKVCTPHVRASFFFQICLGHGRPVRFCRPEALFHFKHLSRAPASRRRAGLPFTTPPWKDERRLFAS